MQYVIKKSNFIIIKTQISKIDYCFLHTDFQVSTFCSTNSNSFSHFSSVRLSNMSARRMKGELGEETSKTKDKLYIFFHLMLHFFKFAPPGKKIISACVPSNSSFILDKSRSRRGGEEVG